MHLGHNSLPRRAQNSRMNTELLERREPTSRQRGVFFWFFRGDLCAPCNPWLANLSQAEIAMDSSNSSHFTASRVVSDAPVASR